MQTVRIFFAVVPLLAALTSARAQLTYASQHGSAIAQSNGCVQNYDAPPSGSWSGSVSCGTGVRTSQASTGATLTSFGATLGLSANNGSGLGASSAADVTFDLAVSVGFIYSADGIGGGTCSLTGPSVNFLGLTRRQGVLVPGRYTMSCSGVSLGTAIGLTCDLQVFALGFEIPWSTLDTGGGSLSADAYTIMGTIGQADAALPILTGGPFRLVSGYWARDTGSPPCSADFDDGSGTGTPDGGVTIDDLLYYIALFNAGSVSADLDDGSGMGTPDMGVTIDDLLYYLQRFEEGC